MLIPRPGGDRTRPEGELLSMVGEDILPTTAHVGVLAKLVAVLAFLAPLGYEDETGFHFGRAPTTRSWTN